jgi:TatD DNase family protein
MKIIDIGVNFHSKQLRGLEDELIERAKAAGVAAVLATGTSETSSRQELALAKRHPGYVFSTVGVHPHSADCWDETVAAGMRELYAEPEVVAVGETGLDFNRNFSTPVNQRRAFKAQLDAAVEHGMPLFLHCRDAFSDFHAMMKDAVAAGAHGVVHCFTGTPDEALAFVELGLDIGITGWVADEKRGQDLREAVRQLPLQSMHLETDAPYLAPKNAKRRRPYNEPANLPWVVRAIAELRGDEVETVASACTANSRRLFKLPV